MGVSSSESHDLTAFYEMLTASFGVLSQNTGFYPSLDRIVETMLRPSNLGPGGGSYNEPISRLQCLLFHEQKYIPNKGTLHLHTIRDHHDHPTAGHFGETKTTELIRHNYHWPGMRHMVGDYIRLCTSCTCTKVTRHKPYGLLKQLPIPGQPWESISMDFIKQLPMSEGFTAILVIVDRLTKQSLFIPTHNMVDAPQLARLFLTHIFLKHGTPGHVTSDHGTEFMSHFFHSLG